MALQKFAMVVVGFSLSLSAFGEGARSIRIGPVDPSNKINKQNCRAYLVKLPTDRPSPHIPSETWSKILKTITLLAVENKISIAKLSNKPRIQKAMSLHTFHSIVVWEAGDSTYFFSWDGKLMKKPNTRRIGFFGFSNDVLGLEDGRGIYVDHGDEEESDDIDWKFTPGAQGAVWPIFSATPLKNEFSDMEITSWERLYWNIQLLIYRDHNSSIEPHDISNPDIHLATSLKTNKSVLVWITEREKYFFSLKGELLKNGNTRNFPTLGYKEDVLQLRDGRVLKVYYTFDTEMQRYDLETEFAKP